LLLGFSAVIFEHQPQYSEASLKICDVLIMHGVN